MVEAGESMAGRNGGCNDNIVLGPMLAFRLVSRPLSTGARFLSEFKRVGVVGLGSMGHGIAQQAALQGFDVVAVDVAPAAVDKGLAAISKSVQKIVGKKAAKSGMSEVRARVGVRRRGARGRAMTRPRLMTRGTRRGAARAGRRGGGGEVDAWPHPGGV